MRDDADGPARAIPAQALEANSVVGVHGGVSMQRKPLGDGHPLPTVTRRRHLKTQACLNGLLTNRASWFFCASVAVTTFGVGSAAIPSGCACPLTSAAASALSRVTSEAEARHAAAQIGALVRSDVLKFFEDCTTAALGDCLPHAAERFVSVRFR